jgi:GNAT superfamily N-acetyltransferase
MNVEVKRLSADLERDLYQVHSTGNCGGWCYCAAWHVPTWEGWGDRTSVQNRNVRETLFADHIYDGYLIYFDGQAKGWCQVAPRDLYPKLVSTYGLEANREVWAVTCMVLAEEYHGTGLAHFVLVQILADLRKRGIKHVQAFPHLGENLPKEDVWTGPYSIYLKAGFRVIRADSLRPVLEKTL